MSRRKVTYALVILIGVISIYAAVLIANVQSDQHAALNNARTVGASIELTVVATLSR